ncbi:protein of unknown function [Zhouia amylolytica]|uniref:DUF4421 domain-containing protein n=1 Tax=Zhouia amylolytica TaxID=376730 RepID=A0A1I6PHU7_9FLAO|nr:DUF4421 family protein [Zhouia amylolytica]SFS39750.1 protein of unknown function [Zhouia amylolytica]
MGLKKALILLFISHCFFITAQGTDSIHEDGYIKSFPDEVALKLAFIHNSNSFGYNDKDANTKYEISPNKKERLSITAQFRSLEVGVGISSGFLPGNSHADDANIINLALKGFYKNWIQDVSFYHQRGFTINRGSGDEISPLMETNKIGGATAYSFNKKFSYRATRSQREWQLKSAGSFIPKLYYYYTNFVLQSSGFNHNSSSVDIALAPSYFYNFVLNEHFMFSSGASAGFGLNYNDFGNDYVLTSLYELSLQGVLSFNYDRFFGGIQSNVLFLKSNSTRYMQFRDTMNYLNIHIGYRFKAPRTFTKTADKINKKLNIDKK